MNANEDFARDIQILDYQLSTLERERFSALQNLQSCKPK